MMKVTACPWVRSKGCAPWRSLRPLAHMGSSFRVDRGQGGRTVPLPPPAVAARACGIELASPLAEVESPPSGRFHHEQGHRDGKVGGTEGSGERAVGPDHRRRADHDRGQAGQAAWAPPRALWLLRGEGAGGNRSLLRHARARRWRSGVRATSTFGLNGHHGEGIMRAVSLVLVSGALALSSSFADAQVTGSSKLGVAVEDVKLVAVGWSVRKDIIGKTVYNESGERVGTIEDLIVAPDSAVSFAIVGAGGFAGVGR